MATATTASRPSEPLLPPAQLPHAAPTLASVARLVVRYTGSRAEVFHEGHSNRQASAGPRCCVSPTCPTRRPGPGRSWSAWRRRASTSSTSTTAPASTRTRCPLVPGMEGAGVVVAVGPGGHSLARGGPGRLERTSSAPTPSTCSCPADRAVAVPPGMGTDTAAALMLQGMTAHYLCTEHLPAEAGPHLPRPRGGGRRRPAARADGEAARGARHRHGGHRGQGRARPRGGRRRGDPLHAGGLPRGGEAPHRRARRGRRVRLGGEDDRREEPRLPRRPAA